MNKYKGGFEPKIARQLRRQKVKFKYEVDRLPYVVYKNYVPDFTITTPNGKIYLEVKGYLRPQDRVKMAAVKATNPDIDLRIVFGADNKLNRFSKMRYSDWAKKYGIPYAVKTIPIEWFKSSEVERNRETD
jgi:predicted nuclease of restriction endonuclease-like RecB superfamily